ncbi:MAG TPA: glucoamylase family protein [Ferruginibacter sp.]|nr:glucoamylase family protein [Ferruginibacter sp.]
MIEEKKIASQTDREMLNSLQRETFDYFVHQVDPVTGLTVDKTQPGFPSSIAVVGMGIASYIAGIHKNFISRTDAAQRIVKTLRFFYNSHQGPEPDATGYKGFYYHFIEMSTGKRCWECELSTVDTTFLIAGALCAANYFTDDTETEKEIRNLADLLYRRVDWQWALNGATTISHGWRPETGFLPFHWGEDYSEAMLMYMLALASPTFPIDKKGYDDWTASFKLRTAYNFTYLYAGPLFIHQFSHMWIDFRNIFDRFNKESGFDYFENSKRATHVHREYAIDNPMGFACYGPNCWGLTASDGPGPALLKIADKEFTFYDYIARGAPFGPDDGTISPWGVVASLPFAPEIVIDTIRHAIEKLELKHHRLYGFDASFNPTYPDTSNNKNGWVSPWRFGLNQGPIVIMIENYQTELIWKIMKQCTYLVNGLRIAGFTGGWLNEIK